MEDNDWVSYPKFIFDLIYPPQGKELQIISSDRKTNFARFDEYTLFGNLLSNIGFRSDQMMWAQGGLNPWPTGYEPVALPG